MPTRRDYDTDPARYRLGMRLTAAYGASGADLHAWIVCNSSSGQAPCGCSTWVAVTGRSPSLRQAVRCK